MQAGDIAGHFEILELLGSGVLTTVYRARNTRLDRIVALKTLRSGADGKTLRRFREEARRMVRVETPYVVTIYTLEELNVGPAIEMKYLEGGSLADRLRLGPPINVSEGKRYLEHALLGLQAIHENGIVHRDIKPANIMFDRKGHLHIGDFGIAAFEGDVATVHAATLQYAAPELIVTGNFDRRSDLYSFGMTVYEMFLGIERHQRVFREVVGGGTDLRPTNWLAWHADPARKVPPLKELIEIDEETSNVVAKLMEKDREQRFQSADAALIHLRSATTVPGGDTNPNPPTVVLDSPAHFESSAATPLFSVGRGKKVAVFLAIPCACLLLLLGSPKFFPLSEQKIYATVGRLSILGLSSSTQTRWAEIWLHYQRSPRSGRVQEPSGNGTPANKPELSTARPSHQPTNVSPDVVIEGPSIRKPARLAPPPPVPKESKAVIGADDVLVHQTLVPVVEEKVFEGRIVKRVPPDYPRVAKLARVEGAVRYMALIGKDGKIQDLKYLDGPPMLATPEVMRAVSEWEYKPYLLNNKSVDVVTEITVRFALSSPSPSKESMPEPVIVGGKIFEGRIVKRVIPAYPQVAKLARVQGAVRYTALIGKDGKIQDLKYFSGPAMLATPEVMKAVSEWEYKPYLLNNEPVEVITEITVNFVLN